MDGGAKIARHSHAGNRREDGGHKVAMETGVQHIYSTNASTYASQTTHPRAFKSSVENTVT
jgi:hypothetical protein